MPRAAIDVTDLHGWGRLAFDATLGLTGVVEAMHREIARAPGILAAPEPGPARGIAGLAYAQIRGLTRLLRWGFDAAFALRAPPAGERTARSAEREAVRAVLNGVVGDHLAATGNPLAIPLRLRRAGRPLVLERRALAAAIPRAGKRILVLVHGACMSDLRWRRHGHDHGAALARELGWTPVYVHYNTGLHVSTNGRELAGALEALCRAWPARVDELAILGHSMGGLVARSACHAGAAAGHRWPGRLRSIVFMGTPHHGAPLERGGSWVDAVLGVSPYTAPLARLGRIRS
ncbi:MAG TPA: alpha/beta hydrolase, partial [Anaeromyxobacteraceae bacterium]|nr:alpha/beta hydrolase [Anaeromyxobacteraceae bacterium]